MACVRDRLRPVFLVLITSALMLLSASSATAAIRYAKPGGTGVAPCADHENPCPLYVAAKESEGAGPGDEIVLAPGTYDDTKGDMGPPNVVGVVTLPLPPGVELHGEAGEPPPFLVFVHPRGQDRLSVQAGDRVSDIEIFAAAFSSAGGMSMFGGVVERVIAQAEGERSAACVVNGGVLRDSVCQANGELAIALGGGEGSNAKLRNVTAIAEGPETVGIAYGAQPTSGPATAQVDARSVIAEGAKFDVTAFATKSAIVQISLNHSDYDTVRPFADADSVATITPPGSGTPDENIIDPPKFASDGFHELADSPTVDKGGVDGESGPFDIDGRRRTIGVAADIGADELTLSTALSFGCSPSLFILESSSTCTVQVRNGVSPTDPPLGEVFFEANGGEFDPESCRLVAVSASQAKCAVRFRSDLPGSFLAFAEYPGDLAHGRSSGLNAIGALPGGQRRAPQTFLRQLHPSKRKPRLARFVFGSPDIGSRFECRLDRAKFKPCRSPMTATVAPGAHVFRVRAVSPDHLVDPTPAVVRWRVPGSRPRRHR